MLYILYRPDSEHARDVGRFYEELEKRRVKAELVDVDSRDGVYRVQSYGIARYPAVLAVRESNGQALQVWDGSLPSVSEAAYHAGAAI